MAKLRYFGMGIGMGSGWVEQCDVTEVKSIGPLKRVFGLQNWSNKVVLPITNWLRGDDRPAMVEIDMFRWISDELSGRWFARFYQELDTNAMHHMSRWVFLFEQEEDAVGFASKYSDEIAGGMKA